MEDLYQELNSIFNSNPILALLTPEIKEFIHEYAYEHLEATGPIANDKELLEYLYFLIEDYWEHVIEYHTQVEILNNLGIEVPVGNLINYYSDFVPKDSANNNPLHIFLIKKYLATEYHRNFVKRQLTVSKKWNDLDAKESTVILNKLGFKDEIITHDDDSSKHEMSCSGYKFLPVKVKVGITSNFS